jgi:hypothetical protein
MYVFRGWSLNLKLRAIEPPLNCALPNIVPKPCYERLPVSLKIFPSEPSRGFANLPQVSDFEFTGIHRFGKHVNAHSLERDTTVSLTVAT